jgi:transposase-like protein
MLRKMIRGKVRYDRIIYSDGLANYDQSKNEFDKG